MGLGLVVAVLVVVGSRAVAERVVDDRPSVDQAERGPVLLVPGYGGSTTALETLATALPDAEVVEAAGDGMGDLRDSAQLLADRVDETLERTGAASVDLVGYSAGGVVVRYYVAALGGADKVRRVVTIASPHHGTDLAALATSVGGGACAEACRQLDPDSDLLRGLNRGDETPAGPRWLSWWTETDETVVPPSSAVLEGATSLSVQELCGSDVAVSHGDIPRDPVTLEVVEDFLGDPAGDGSSVDAAC